MSQDGSNDGDGHGRQMLTEGGTRASVSPRVLVTGGVVLIKVVSGIAVTVGRDREVAVVITGGRCLVHKAVALVVAFAAGVGIGSGAVHCNKQFPRLVVLWGNWRQRRLT